MTERRIVTDFVCPPIPMRQFDWCAWFDGEEEHGPQGWGRTEQEAVDALKEETEHDQRTSFTPLSEREAEEFKERLRIDRASVYST